MWYTFCTSILSYLILLSHKKTHYPCRWWVPIFVLDVEVKNQCFPLSNVTLENHTVLVIFYIAILRSIYHRMKHTFQAIEIYPFFVCLSYTMLYRSIPFANELNQIVRTIPLDRPHCVCSFKYWLPITIGITIFPFIVIKIWCSCYFPSIHFRLFLLRNAIKLSSFTDPRVIVLTLLQTDLVREAM